MVVHHDLQTVPEYFDWVVLLNRVIIETGPIDKVFTEENLKRTYRSSHEIYIEKGM